MVHCFYANFVERVIHYYIDRNLHRVVGPDRVARSVHELRSFDEAIRRHRIDYVTRTLRDMCLAC